MPTLFVYDMVQGIIIMVQSSSIMVLYIICIGEKTPNEKSLFFYIEVNCVCSQFTVASKGSQRFYIQSAYSIENDMKKQQEERSLREIDDSFKKIIVVYDSVKPYYNDRGFLIIGLIDFLLDEKSLQF